MYIIVFTCRRQKSKQQTPSSHPPCLHKLFWTNIFQFPCQHCHFERFDRANRFFLKPTVGGWNPMNPINRPLLILGNQSSETDVGGIYMWLKTVKKVEISFVMMQIQKRNIPGIPGIGPSPKKMVQMIFDIKFRG